MIKKKDKNSKHRGDDQNLLSLLKSLLYSPYRLYRCLFSRIAEDCCLIY